MDDYGADQARRMAQQAAGAAVDASRRASESHERFKQMHQESLRSQRHYQHEPTAPRSFARTAIQAIVAIVVVLLGVSYLIGGQSREGETSPPKDNAPVAPGRNDPPSTGRPDNDAAKTLVMPDVVGENNVNSVMLMHRAGFDPQNVLIEAVPAPLDQFGKVIRTSPKPGKKVSSDAIVRLYIGRGGP